jgi:hypothetical protein
VEKNKQPFAWALAIAAILLFQAGWWIPQFPVFLFFAWIPLLAIVPLLSQGSNSPLVMWGAGTMILALSFAGKALAIHEAQVLEGLWVGVLMGIIFLLYGFTQKYAKNRLGVFSLLIFWLGVEYLLISLAWVDLRLLLPYGFHQKESWIGWTYYLGWQGISLWVGMVGVLWYNALLAGGGILKGRLRLLRFVLPILLMLLPMVWVLPEVEPITLEMVISRQAVTSAPQVGGKYAESGEFIGRTAFWIAIFMLLFALVKAKTQRKHGNSRSNN